MKVAPVEKYKGAVSLLLRSGGIRKDGGRTEGGRREDGGRFLQVPGAFLRQQAGAQPDAECTNARRKACRQRPGLKAFGL